ncbi:aldo/keto reductase [Kurthia sibirica]|uniref:Oxidoreductase n=1 Tax=Kurthia sibirica TaxID=202750 RepID=A0A2U3AR52_9BACL|nr:aldo/keto reductase [Kurthia sibirica]PWI27004.1 oxidoreductase [Kurthia sibirica]GEK34452.1 putative oxidoreductase YqkF [Kurthia sibirica]
MKYRKLGSSDMSISELGFGCMSLPMDLNEAKYMLDAAVDSGINFFDTADLYNRGQNEMIVGDALRKKRSSIYLATKVGNVWNEDEDTWRWDASKVHIKEGVKKSLMRLGTDYLDLYQLHGGTTADNFDEITDAFEELKREGTIRNYGISSIRPNVIKEFLTVGRPVSVMMQYSALDRRPEEWFEFIQSKGASIISRGSIAKGLLSDNWQQKLEKTNGFLDYSQQELELLLHSFDHDTHHLLNAALTFNLAQPAVASLIVGASTKAQLYSTIDAYHHPVADEVIEKMQHITKDNKYTEHID